MNYYPLITVSNSIENRSRKITISTVLRLLEPVRGLYYDVPFTDVWYYEDTEIEHVDRLILQRISEFTTQAYKYILSGPIDPSIHTPSESQISEVERVNSNDGLYMTVSPQVTNRDIYHAYPRTPQEAYEVPEPNPTTEEVLSQNTRNESQRGHPIDF